MTGDCATNRRVAQRTLRHNSVQCCSLCAATISRDVNTAQEYPKLLLNCIVDLEFWSNTVICHCKLMCQESGSLTMSLFSHVTFWPYPLPKQGYRIRPQWVAVLPCARTCCQITNRSFSCHILPAKGNQMTQTRIPSCWLLLNSVNDCWCCSIQCLSSC